jgi:hypothetical protein
MKYLSAMRYVAIAISFLFFGYFVGAIFSPPYYMIEMNVENKTKDEISVEFHIENSLNDKTVVKINVHSYSSRRYVAQADSTYYMIVKISGRDDLMLSEYLYKQIESYDVIYDGTKLIGTVRE